MPIFNVRLAAILLVSLVVVGGGVHLLHGFQVGRYARALQRASQNAEDEHKAALKKANEATNSAEKVAARAESGKDLEEAIRLMRDYVRLVPHDHGAEIHLGLLYAERQDFRNAFACLEEGIRLAEMETSSPPVTPEEIHDARSKLVKDVAFKIRDGNIQAAGQKHLKLLLAGVEERNRHRKEGEKPEGDPELLDLYGSCLNLDQKEKEACQVLQDVIELAPDRVETYARLAYTLRFSSHDEAAADAVIESMLAKNPKLVPAYQTYVEYKLRQIHWETHKERRSALFDVALAKARKALAMAPDDPRCLLLVGTCYYFHQDFAKAEDFLRKGIQATKDTTDLARHYKQLAETQAFLRKDDEALATLQRGIEATRGTPGCLELLWSLVDTQIRDGKRKEAEKNIKELRDEGFPPQYVDYLKAFMAFQDAHWAKAERLLRESVLPRTPESPGPGLREIVPLAMVRYRSLLFRAECIKQTTGDVNERIIALQQATKVLPNLLPARAALAEIYAGQGRLALAEEQYREAMKGPQSEEAAVSLVRTMIVTRKLMKDDPEHPRDWTPVEQLLDQLMANKSPRPELVGLKAEVLLDQGKESEAAELLETCLKDVPKNGNAWLKLVQLAIHQAGKQTDPVKQTVFWKKGDAYCDQAEKALGDCVIVRMARGTLAVARKDSQTQDVLKKLGENTDALSSSDKMQLWNVLVNLSIQAEDFDLGRSYLRRIAEKDPKNSLARSRLCELDLRSFERGRPVDMEELDRLVDELKKVNEEGPYWLYAKAVRTYIQAKDKDPQMLSEARDNLQKALEIRKGWAVPAALAGKIFELQKNPSAALAFYLYAIREGERDSDLVGRTVRLLAAQPYLDELLRGGTTQVADEGRLHSAMMLFGVLEGQKSPLFQEMHQEYVCVKAFCCDEKEIPEVQKLVESLVAPDCKDYRDFARQGELYSVLTNRLRAVAAKKTDPKTNDWMRDAAMLQMAQHGVDSLFKAKALEPQADEVWIALVRLLVDIGQFKNARNVIDDAKRTLKSDKVLAMIGACYEAISEPAKAEENYTAAVKAFPQDCRVLRRLATFYLHTGRPALAEPQLRSIISLQSPATLMHTCWARRNLAAILRNRGDFDSRSQAMELLDENLRSPGASPEDKRMKVAYLQADPRKRKIDDAIALQQELVQEDLTREKMVGKRFAETTADEFVLAQLYSRKGGMETDDAQKNHYKAAYEEQMRAALASPYAQPVHYITYIYTLMDRREFEDADRWLQNLEKIPLNNFDTLKDREEYLLRTLQTREEYLFRRGQYSDAIDGAMRYVEKLDPQSQDRARQILFVASLLESYGNRLKADKQPEPAADFVAKAGRLFESLRNMAVDGNLVWVQFCARQGRVDEALTVLQQCWDKDHPDQLLEPALGIVQSSAATAQQLEQLEKFLNDALKSSRSTAVLLALSSLHERQHEYGKAIETYREILAKQPKDFRVLNNLGVVLAQNGGDLNEALTLVNRALEITGPKGAVLDSRALVYIARQEYDKALEDITAAINSDGSAEQYFHQAWILYLLERRNEAAAALKTAEAKHLNVGLINPKELDAYNRLKDSL